MRSLLSQQENSLLNLSIIFVSLQAVRSQQFFAKKWHHLTACRYHQDDHVY